MRPFLTSLCVVLGLVVAPAPAALAGDAADLARKALTSGDLAAGEQSLRTYLSGHAADGEARFGLGLVLFAQAVEHFGQAQYRYGLHVPRSMSLPLLRFPVAANPAPEVLTYEAQRANLAAFLADLQKAEAALAAVTDPAVKIRLNLGDVALDVTSKSGAGKASLAELAASLMSNGRTPSQDMIDRTLLEVGFDRSDALWLRGYCNMLSAMLQFVLAYDWHETFEAVGPAFYPKVEPASPLAKLAVSPDALKNGFFGDNVSLADALTLIHELRWPLAEPERLKAAHGHLKQVIALSRETWTSIGAETDDEREWLPGPKQKDGVLPMPISADQVAGWQGVLTEFEAVLDGRKLIPHWRFVGGVNLRRVFFEPRRFDAVMWATGHDAAPYIETGPQITAATWANWQRIFGGNFLGYAFWIN